MAASSELGANGAQRLVEDSKIHQRVMAGEHVPPAKYEDWIVRQWGRDAHAEELLGMVKDHVDVKNARGEPSRVVEVGSGTGLAAEILGREYVVFGFDNSQESVGYHRRKESRFAEPVVADMTAPFPYQTGSIDAVTTLGLNRFMNTPRQLDHFLNESLRVLPEEDGTLIWPILYPLEDPYWRRNMGGLWGAAFAPVDPWSLAARTRRPQPEGQFKKVAIKPGKVDLRYPATLYIVGQT